MILARCCFQGLLVLFIVHLTGSLHGRPRETYPSLQGMNIAALASSDERLFVGGFDSGLRIVKHGGGDAQTFNDPALSRHINALAWDEASQKLWAGTARGLVRCSFSGGGACEKVGSAKAVHALLLSADGTLISGGDAGLLFVKGKNVRSFGRKLGAPFRSVWALAEDEQGTLFVGTTNGLFHQARDAFAADKPKLRRAALVSGELPDDWITALVASETHIYVGTYNAGVVSLARQQGKLVTDQRAPQLGYVNPAGLFRLEDEAFAVSTMDGLYSGPLSRAKKQVTLSSDITAVLPAWDSGYWIATRKGLEFRRTPLTMGPFP